MHSIKDGAVEGLQIRNWSKWQSWRKGRGQPPWIKLWRCLLRNVEWVSLTDGQRGQLVAMWLLAADHDGAIPASPRVLAKLCHMDSEPDLDLFTRLGFIETGASVAPTWRQIDALETETETETETEREQVASGPRPRGDKGENKEKVWTDWITTVQNDIADSPVTPGIWAYYVASLAHGLEDYYEKRGGRLTPTRRAYLARSLGKHDSAAQLFAIEIYCDDHAGTKDERYVVGIARKKDRLSIEELDREWAAHRARQAGRGLWDGRPK